MRISMFLIVLLAVAGTAGAGGQRAGFGVQVSLASEQEMFNSGPSSRVRLSLIQLQFPITLIFTEDEPRLQVINEVALGGSFHPSRRIFFGMDETLRLHLRPGKKFGWYTEIGAGIYSVSLQVHELDGWMQYTLHGGVGIRIATSPGSLVLGYRLMHFSNNGTTMPNRGLNLHTMVIGYTIVFK